MIPLTNMLRTASFPRSLLRVGLGLLVGALLWSGLGPAAWAQQTRTLDIRDGTIYLDGQPLSEDRVPDELALDGVNAYYRFMGIRRPVVELNGHLVALADSGLTPVSDEDVRNTDASVVMQGGTARAGAPQPSADGQASAHQQYLHDVQESSRELYEQLQRERRMEQKAQDLARIIRMQPDGEPRQEKIDSLRTMLNDLFELKQDNHRREIDRLQRKIQELQRRLQKREEMRSRMIDHRLQQLVGTGPDE